MTAIPYQRTRKSDRVQTPAAIIYDVQNIVSFQIDGLAKNFSNRLQSYNKILQPLFDKIDALREFEDDWEEEGTLRVSEQTSSAAKVFLRALATRINQDGLTWVEPSVSSDPRGRLHLLWRTGTRRTLLIVAPQGNILGKSVRTENDGQPAMLDVSQNAAIDHVLWVVTPS